MSDEGDTRPRGGRLHLETRRERVRCTCADGHVFVATIFKAIDIDINPAALDQLTDKGLQPVTCPVCEANWPLAEPIALHAREGGRFALFVPEPLAHLELHLRAELTREAANADPETVPSYVADFETLVGARALKYWLFGPSASALATVPPPRRTKSAEPKPPADAAPAPEPSRPVSEPSRPAPEPKPAPQARPQPKQKPAIHEAFADLMGPEVRTSTIPPELDMDALDADDEEPLLDEDWLDDDALDAGYERPASPLPGAPRSPGSRHAQPPPAAEDASPREARPGRDADPPVDFADLLSADDDDLLVEDDDLDEAAEAFELEDEEEAFGDSIDDGLRGAGKRRPARPGLGDSSGALDAGVGPDIEVIGDRVILRHRVDPDEADRYDPSRSDLWIQLHVIGGFPLVLLTLVTDRKSPERGWLSWPLDLRREPHREVVHALRRSFRAEVRLVVEPDGPRDGFEIGADRELNAAVVLKRATQMLEELEGDAALFESAVASASSLARPLGSEPPPPFDPERLPRPTGTDETWAQLETLAVWTSGERRDDLVLVRSFPLDHLEKIVAELLDAALELGVALPEPIAERAVESGRAADRAALAARLFARFDETVRRSGADDDATARNWRRLMDECARRKVEIEAGARDRAEKALERHGLRG